MEQKYRIIIGSVIGAIFVVGLLTQHGSTTWSDYFILVVVFAGLLYWGSKG